MIEAEFFPSPMGPARKYYSLTSEGNGASSRVLHLLVSGGRCGGKSNWLKGSRPERSPYDNDFEKLEKRKQKKNRRTCSRRQRTPGFRSESNFEMPSMGAADSEILIRDLVGMAEEARLRGENFSQVMGEEKKHWCESLRESYGTVQPIEKVLYSLRNTFKMASLYWMLFYGMDRRNASHCYIGKTVSFVGYFNSRIYCRIFRCREE